MTRPPPSARTSTLRFRRPFVVGLVAVLAAIVVVLGHPLLKSSPKYGSEAEAARWVATATTSPHVSGDAVDIGPDRATDWLSEHGSAYGLCRIYRNEPWHFELRTDAADRGCPRMYDDPTQDPRMRQ